MTGPFPKVALQLAEAGFVPIPLKPESKAPAIPKWQTYADDRPSQELYDEWIKKYPRGNVGVLTGVALDESYNALLIDVDSDALVAGVKAQIGAYAWEKRGKKGTGTLVRTPVDDPVASTTIRAVGDIGSIDILGKGRQTVVPPSIHPDTKAPYEAIGGDLWLVDKNELPIWDQRENKILRTWVEAPELEVIRSGKQTHLAAVALIAKLISAGATDAKAIAIVTANFTADYAGDTPQHLQEMCDSARKKGFDQPNDRGDPMGRGVYDPGDVGPLPMGYLENSSYVFFDQPRHLLIVETSNRLTSLATLMNMAPRSFWENRFPKMKDGRCVGTDSMLAADVLMAACRAKGGFDPGQVRGRGVYMDNGQIVVNFGDPVPENVKHLYVCWLPVQIDADPEAALDPTPVVTLLQRFNWANPSSVFLLIGWAVLAVICGALDWRPHIFITGSKNTGKSTLIEVMQRLLGAIAIVLDGTSTEAGIRQKIGPDSRPVILDEFEADSNIPRMKNIIKLARSASSASGHIARGTPEGKALEFNIQSSFLFGAITPMAVTAADRSRIVVLALEKHQSDPEVAEAIARDMADLVDVAPKWSGAAISQIENILASIPVIRTVMPPCDSRHALNISSLLAGAWCLLNRREISEAEARSLIAEHMAAITELEAAHDGDDATDCLSTLLEYRLNDSLMLGTMLAYSKRKKLGNPDDRASLMRKLQTFGIKQENDGFLISNSHRGLKDVFQGTAWEAGGWNASLSRLPGAEKTKQRRFGDHRGEAVWLPASIVPDEYDDGHELPIDRF